MSSVHIGIPQKIHFADYLQFVFVNNLMRLSLGMRSLHGALRINAQRTVFRMPAHGVPPDGMLDQEPKIAPRSRWQPILAVVFPFVA